MKEVLDFIRGLVRPVVTIMVIAALLIVLNKLVAKFADIEMAKTVLVAFLSLVAAATGFWFGSRKTGGQ